MLSCLRSSLLAAAMLIAPTTQASSGTTASSSSANSSDLLAVASAAVLDYLDIEHCVVRRVDDKRAFILGRSCREGDLPMEQWSGLSGVLAKQLLREGFDDVFDTRWRSSPGVQISAASGSKGSGSVEQVRHTLMQKRRQEPASMPAWEHLVSATLSAAAASKETANVLLLTTGRQSEMQAAALRVRKKTRHGPRLGRATKLSYSLRAGIRLTEAKIDPDFEALIKALEEA